MTITGSITGRGMTLSDILARWSRVTPDAVGFVDAATRERRTYAQADDRITRLANTLLADGVAPGDRVAVIGLNGVALLESYIAVLRAGAICVPVNFRLVAGEVAYTLNDSGAVAVVADTATADVVRAARADVPGLRRVITIGGDLEEVLDAADPTYHELAIADDATAFIMYTSGTTGAPKGAMLTHRNLYLHAFSSTMHLGGPGGPSVWMAGTPLFHIAGLAGFLPSLLAGGTTIIPASGGFDPDETLAILERERVTACFFVPAQWAALCARPGVAERDLSALRKGSWGAAPASTTLLRTMIATFPDAEIVTSFGQTECSPVTTTLRGEDAVRKLGSVGTPMINVEVRVVDDAMEDVAPGEVGEIVYRGPLVMSGYWNKPEETAEAFRGGWFHSGDLVRQDPDGYYYVVDRKKDMIISGGENIYCAEVENVLAGHPQVADVALIGVPDDRWGETPLAVVVPKDPADPPTLDALDEHCRSQLARYKRPRRLTLVDALPRNATGKVQKTVLREREVAGSPTAPEAVS
ncbi:long-chain-fatty-acid--CoA ligase [Actinomycetospora sp. NBRC 106375]|uniref:long-chain-fatty-acid--CoA ligase n=1 Tax=Actinomycetospora sp. NBRC 106375 TaxID=3032207 RepID=UPI0024A2323C|nr:long-chain-fatty-acid--CoA ligase [Actinomycetospora sp. NBRC 106375]GLZ50157.1 long-chain-fatty-acid--CoA ligase [Actinomycetospora sp. NBRC 106375]